MRGTVVAVGNGKPDEPMTVKAGDTVLYGKYAGTEISIDGKSNHAALHQIIAEVRADGGFTILKDFGKVAAKTDCVV